MDSVHKTSVLLADRTVALCPSVTLCIVGLRVSVGVESCTTRIVFLGRHVLLTSSDTFSVGPIVCQKYQKVEKCRTGKGRTKYRS